MVQPDPTTPGWTLDPDLALTDPGWRAALGPILAEPQQRTLVQWLNQRAAGGAQLYPPAESVFRALNATPVEQVKVVILGQDPYHGPGQAQGLSFSVPTGVRFPPSLRNIFKELASDVPFSPPDSGDLTPWTQQGVLLLNAVLTVEQGQANAHQGKGWEAVTDAVIDHINRHRDDVVFMLWGSYAQKKGQMIDRQRHCVLTAPHPSPLSAHRGWFGSGHFSKANAYLRGTGQTPVDWQLQATVSD
ncbi:uracil-DNA glycosylase [Saccharospirillum alexandrii]|uniref:uracil-DNA glycosylase n=1 Tax=Saccharospirillum alexandrii TaxID=2448477 RepID=UPI000FD738F9|nr:uracil-DNA glycosylase [Saccharospirillum alexandrii]